MSTQEATVQSGYAGPETGAAAPAKVRVLVCEGTGCVSSKAPDIRVALQKSADELGLGDRIEVGFTGCHGFCQKGPIVVVEPEGIFYCRVSPKDAPDIARAHLAGGEPVKRLFYRHPVTKEPVPYYRDIMFYKKQQRVILRNCGKINPERISEYEAHDGYRALRKAIAEMTPAGVVEEVRKSGLRGRGGAGFATATKWDICRKQPGRVKYVICNADEGDPGAFMDRSILEADPHSVLEGLTLLGYAIGATKGIIYCRAEYPLAVKRVRVAIDQARERGYLGKKILGSDFDFDVELFEGAGAFVCGEETALIGSIQGSRGMPRSRPPFPAEKGLWGKPTVINNVKTLASVPVIVSRGADWFASIGTETSKGTAVFALTGKIANSGLVEVPMGAPLSSIIYDIGGGIPNKKSFKAVQTGGPSGGCLPGSLLELSIDFDSLKEAGSMMGSGGLVVMDNDTCIVDVAHFFLSFTQSESCGKCVPCRVGTRHMVELLDKIRTGKGTMEDLAKLEKLAGMIKMGSLCGLGQTAPNPVLTALRYFRAEFVSHVVDKRCPAAACRELVTFRIIPDRCTGCQMCVKVCPTKAITGPRSQVHNLDQSKCIKCRACYEICRFDAVAGDAIILVS
jgi:NADH:ubiquinone oxidoreductase subunit F (NADH-binding)/(2Fe-2S) ferredoxin/NAD-dependent dihydropyrimidine dehydrogenase PreA subunit